MFVYAMKFSWATSSRLIIFWSVNALPTNTMVRSAILGTLVADASGMGLHWIYSQGKIAKAVKANGGGAEFLEPDESNYGEYIYVLLRDISEGGFDPGGEAGIPEDWIQEVEAGTKIDGDRGRKTCCWCRIVASQRLTRRDRAADAASPSRPEGRPAVTFAASRGATLESRRRAPLGPPR